MNTMVRNWVIGAAGALMVMSGAAHAQDKELTFIIPTPPGAAVLPVLVAQDKGWYEAEGLKVELKVVPGDANTMRALLAGEGDLAYLGAGTTMLATLNGADLKIIGSGQPIVDYRIIAGGDAAKTIEDLGSKRWATASVGGMTEVLPKMAMEKNGVDFSNAEFMSVGGQSSRYQAVVAGTVDAALVSTAFAVRGRDKDNLTIVRATTDDFPMMAYGYYVVQASALEDAATKEALSIFVDGSIRGARLIMEDPAAAAKVLASGMGSDDVEGLTAVLEEMNGLGVWGVNGGTEKEIYEFTEGTLTDMGELSSPVAYDDLVDTSLVDASLEKLGKQ